MNWKNIFIPGKLWHAIKIEAKTIAVLSRYGLPDIMPQFLGGLGDELLLTCVAHELKKRHPDFRIWQVSSAEELLRHNPDYVQVFPMDYWYLRYSNILNRQRVRLRYSEQPVAGEQEIPPQEHILAHLCSAAGIRGQIQLRPYYYQTEVERNSGRLAPRQICVHSMGENTHETWMRNKVWYHERFQELVDALLGRYSDLRVIQIGVDKDPPLKGVLDLRGKTSLRQTASILSRSECFVGTQGLLAHLARAVECRAVIIYGGREHSRQSGYICNENLDSFVECAPCWHWNECTNSRKCMDMIKADNVLAAIDRILARLGQALETESYSIQ